MNQTVIIHQINVPTYYLPSFLKPASLINMVLRRRPKHEEVSGFKRECFVKSMCTQQTFPGLTAFGKEGARYCVASVSWLSRRRLNSWIYLMSAQIAYCRTSYLK